jgi:hypothetical protein
MVVVVGETWGRGTRKKITRELKQIEAWQFEGRNEKTIETKK